MKMVLPGKKPPHLPPDHSINFEVDHHHPSTLIHNELLPEVRWQGHKLSTEERRPNSDVFVSLVRLREGSGGGDLLAFVGSEDDELVVERPYACVGIGGDNRYLDVGSDVEVRSDDARDNCGDVEVIDGGVLEDEGGFGGAKDEPSKKEGEEDEKDENKDTDDAEGKKDSRCQYLPL
ncbi:unnamed protein product [Cuscuta campestris]|uniref:Uncharacterized protein n=1 Tax=Cuscuta campestris TaxID=132261 RepID=A0A484N285_9ASTE|nr:unnamed protein product [Cuscuta campestris]